MLYLIEILHQTTTWLPVAIWGNKLYLIEILHQTTTPPWAWACSLCCILLKFYIKPQLRQSLPITFTVVSYWNSTSNHNIWIFFFFGEIVVSYWNSTSNHNRRSDVSAVRIVVSYWNSTSNHNSRTTRRRNSKLYLIEILHQTTTSGEPHT